MKDAATHPIAADYRDEVARALADLPTGEAEEILDDVEVNLAEVVAEFGEAVTAERLRTRLGSPAEYAAELRAAAGYPPAETRAARNRTARLVLVGLLVVTLGAFAAGIGLGADQRWWIGPAVAALALEVVNALWLRGREPDLPEAAALSVTRRARALGESLRTGKWAEQVRFVTGLQSAWWLVRAVIPGVAVGVLLSSAWWGLATGVAALVVSLWLAPKPTGDRRMLWAAIPVNALVIGLAIGLIGSGELDDRNQGYVGAYYPLDPAGPGGPMYINPNGDGSTSENILRRVDGRLVENIYPFDTQGRPLKDVLLFDEQGRQLLMADGAGYEEDPALAECVDRLLPDRTLRGLPQPRGVWNNGEERTSCRLETGVPFTIAVPRAPEAHQGPTDDTPQGITPSSGATTAPSPGPATSGPPAPGTTPTTTPPSPRPSSQG